MKTKEEIEAINRERARCLEMLKDAQTIMRVTGCSLGADIIGEAIAEIQEGGMDEY